MKSYNIYLLRGISSYNKFVAPHHLNFNFNIKWKLIFFQNSRPRPNLRLVYPIASYTCGRPTVDFVFHQSKPHSRPKIKYISREIGSPHTRPTTSVVKLTSTRNKNIPSKLKIKDAAVGSTDDLFSYKENRWNDENIFLSLRQYIKPVSLSLDDIQIKNLSATSISESQDVKLFNSSIRLDQNVVNILPRIFSCSLIESPRHTTNEVLQFNNERFLVENNSFETPKHFQGVKNPYILYCSSSNKVSPATQEKPSGLGRPSEEQLAKVYHQLSEGLPNVFVKSLDYRLHSPDIIFENRITGTRSVGLFSYTRQVSVLRFVGHIKYAFVKFEILKITQHPEDSTVRVRWRIIGISALKSLPMLFTLKAYTLQHAKEKMHEWHDGFSTYYVGENGLIYKHVADKMMPDKERSVVKKPSLATRLASLLGLAPKTPAPTGTAVTSSVIDVPKKTDVDCNKSAFGVCVSA